MGKFLYQPKNYGVHVEGPENFDLILRGVKTLRSKSRRIIEADFELRIYDYLTNFRLRQTDGLVKIVDGFAVGIKDDIRQDLTNLYLHYSADNVFKIEAQKYSRLRFKPDSSIIS